MPVKWLFVILCFSPVAVYAMQESDMELFEFLALYEQHDNVFIDAEIDDENKDVEHGSKLNLTTLPSENVIKSEANE